MSPVTAVVIGSICSFLFGVLVTYGVRVGHSIRQADLETLDRFRSVTRDLERAARVLESKLLQLDELEREANEATKKLEAVRRKGTRRKGA